MFICGHIKLAFGLVIFLSNLFSYIKKKKQLKSSKWENVGIIQTIRWTYFNCHFNFIKQTKCHSY